jgi:hypothetical protein
VNDMGITPAEMLRQSIKNQNNVFEVINAIRAYPFIMKNQNGNSFKPDDVINLITNSIDPEGNLKRDFSRHRMIDNTYGLQATLSALAPKQAQQPTSTTTSPGIGRSMLFSRPTESTTKQTETKEDEPQPEQTTRFTK